MVDLFYIKKVLKGEVAEKLLKYHQKVITLGATRRSWNVWVDENDKPIARVYKLRISKNIIKYKQLLILFYITLVGQKKHLEAVFGCQVRIK